MDEVLMFVSADARKLFRGWIKADRVLWFTTGVFVGVCLAGAFVGVTS